MIISVHVIFKKGKKMDEVFESLSLEELLGDYAGVSDAWYWIGMAYMERGDYQDAAKWLDKTKNDTGDHGWQGKATLNLGTLYWKFLNRKQDAMRLFESIPSFALARLYAGYMYFSGDGVTRDAGKGLRYVEESIQTIINARGNDDLFAGNECFWIAEVFCESGKREKAKEYLSKTIARCNTSYASERDLMERARGLLLELG